MKKYIVLALVAFALNSIWEHLHALLYVHYRGGAITEFVLLQASLVDTLYIVGAVFFLYRLRVKNIVPILVFFWIAVAVGIEWWALGTGRWAYREAMPIIPLLGTGLSPTIQLAVTGALSYAFIFGTKKTL